jgi:hypothetical protein
MEESGVAYAAPSRHLYRLDLPKADAAKFLDWDAPLSEQPANVKSGLRSLLGDETYTRYERTGPNGQEIYRALSRDLPRSGENFTPGWSPEEMASEALRKAGIPGLKYLDQFNRDNKNLYKGKSLVKKNGKALLLNEDWQQQGRDVLQYLVDNNMGMGEFIREQREFYGQKGRISRALGGARQQEKLLDILEGTRVEESPLTRNMVIWDQLLLDQLRTVRKEAAGGFIDKPLYDNLMAPSRGSFIDKPLYEGVF